MRGECENGPEKMLDMTGWRELITPGGGSLLREYSRDGSGSARCFPEQITNNKNNNNKKKKKREEQQEEEERAAELTSEHWESMRCWR